MIGLKTATQAGRGPYKSPSFVSTIGRLRRQQGFTQLACAKYCCVSLRTFQRAEAGHALPMNVKRSIERALGLPW